MKMVNRELIEQDLKHIWHPCSQMKEFETNPPLIIKKAQGSYLFTEDGPVIDAISSWWCKSLGHGHPAVIQAIQHQLKLFEHVIQANTTHPIVAELGQQLSELSGKQHVFFASDGSSAVEIALKLALQATQIKGYTKRKQFVALSNGYHGETMATMAISDVGRLKQSFGKFGLPCTWLQNIPYVTGVDDPLWKSCETHWQSIEKQLNTVQDRTCAIIVEPIVQGAGNMRCYSQDLLNRLANWAKKHDIYLIADEIMTGLGRTGKWLASHHASISPDLICLSKGITSGTLPLSCTLIDHAIYTLFYNDIDRGPAFLHSHTYGGNPLAVAAALATIKTMHKENINEQALALSACMERHFAEIVTQSGYLSNVRCMGALIAADLAVAEEPGIGRRVAVEALKRGALLRPIGNTLYWLPPLNTTSNTIEKLAEITYEAIRAAYVSKSNLRIKINTHKDTIAASAIPPS